MAEWPVPISVTAVQQYVGLCNYYRRFILNFAKVAAPLTELTKKGVAFVWTTKHQVAFDTLRELMLQAPVLRIFDPDLETRVCCDASDFAAGSVLEQQFEKCWQPIEYWSKKFTTAEANYCATDREFLAIVMSLEKWRQYLISRQFTVLTDHASLVHL